MDRIITKKYREHNADTNALNETLFHNANGYIGVRASLEEGVPVSWSTMRGTYLNGLYDIIPMEQAEALCNFVNKKDTMVNVADTMTIKCSVEGDEFDMCKGTLDEHVRTLNMDEGYTQRCVKWISPKRKGIEITSKRMTSFEKLSFFSIEYTIKAIDSCDIKLSSYHNADVTNYSNPNDPRVASHSIKNMRVIEMGMQDGASYEVSETSVSKLKMCSVSKNILKIDGQAVKGQAEINKNIACESFEFHLDKNQEAKLIKYNIYTDSLRHENVLKTAYADLYEVLENGIGYYYEKQKAFLEDFWKHSGMEIVGDDANNVAMAFNMYELLQSAARDKFCSIAAKGMSGEGYEGHYFWDTEVFILPFFILTNPRLAKQILNYRYYTLDKARENSALLGHKKGALYPWRTITGAECSGYFVSGSAAYHINADIAYAIISYYLTTGDLDFIADTGEEMLLETARLWMDLGNYNQAGEFVLNEVTGPDEYTCMVNNNYYTNCAAKYNILWAVKLYKLLEKKGKESCVRDRIKVTTEELEEMENAAQKMLLPYDERLGINPQDDSFLDKPVWDFENTGEEEYPLLLHYHPLHLYRYQVCKQADTILAYFMFEEMQDYDVMCRSYDYYEKITTHDSSLSTCVFSIVASRLGMYQKGYEYFGDSTKLDLENTHNNTKDGIHTANMGGCYMAIVNGFAGLRINENGLFIKPHIPERWQEYQFNIVYHDNLINIKVDMKKVSVSLNSGESVIINIYGKEYLLEKGSQVIVEE